MNAPPNPSLEPGRRLGRYVIEALLGIGGMGAVYRARDTELERVVALKVVRPGRKDESGIDPEARLLGEARAVASLRHRNVVAVFDAGVLDGQTFVAMEYVEGRPLRAFVGDQSISLDQRRRWLVEVAEALAAAHRAGIVHRDVKPENILVAQDGQARVLDFGIAKRVAFDTSAPTSDSAAPQTIEGRVVGTISYMAPEQLSGAEVSPKWDQFSWGVVAYELLTGKHPRQTVAMPGATAHLTQIPALPSEIEPRLTFADVAVITLAMAPIPERRFPSMNELVAAWREEKVAAGPPADGPRPALPATPIRRYVIAAVVTSVVGVGIGVGMRGTPKRTPGPAITTLASTVTPSTGVASAPPEVHASAPVATSSAAPTAPATPVTRPVAKAENYDTNCACYPVWKDSKDSLPLCRPGADFMIRACSCNNDKGFLDPAPSVRDGTFTGRSFVEGQPCHGLDSDGRLQAGTLIACRPGCSSVMSGYHRTPCKGIESLTGRELEGVILCEF